MAGIRIKGLGKKTEERHLKIYFSKPENGGGKITKIYYPLFNNDAVILFSDKKVSSKVVNNEHSLHTHSLNIEILPEHMVFTSVSAKLDPEASVLVQITQSLRDEMQFAEGINIQFDLDETCVLHGNWFQLEWAWCYIDCFMKQQAIIQHEISQQPQKYARIPMEVDDPSRYRTESPSNSADILAQSHDKDKSQKNTGQKKMELRTNSYDNEIPSLSYRESHTHSKCSRERSLSPPSPDREAYNEKKRRSKPSSRSPLDNMESLKQNINSVYEVNGEDYDPRNGGNHQHVYDEDNDFSLHGSGFNVQADSMVASTREKKLDRSADENMTFRQFSGMESIGKHSPISSDSEHTHTPRKHGYTWSGEQDSLHVSPHLNPSADKIPSASQSARKPSIDSIDHSLGLSKPGISVQPMQVPDKYTADQLCHTFNINGLKVTVYYGNLVNETTDAIVNAANEELEFYGGIAYAIEKARGPEMKQECQKYLLKNSRLKTTEVMHTSGGGNIQSTHIIHAAGPMWFARDERARERNAYQLMKTFLNCLEYANERLWVKSLALPAISSGVYGAPLDECVRCFLDAVLIFTSRHHDCRLADVRLVNNDAESTVTSIVLIQTLLDQGTASLTEAAMQLVDRNTKTRDRALNLPRGRQEKSGLSSSFMQSTTLGVSYGMDSTSGNEKKMESDTKTPTSASRRRSSSVDSRNRKKLSEASTKTYDIKSSKFVQESIKADSASVGNKLRSRTNSIGTDTTKSASPSLSRTIGGASGVRTSETSTGSKSSSRYGCTADKTAKTPPKMKGSLLNTSKLDNYKRTSTKKVGSLYQTTNDYGAIGHSDLKGTLTNTTTNDEDEYGLRSLPADLHAHTSMKQQTSFREKFLSASSSNTETCAICLDEIRNPKQLSKCKHMFCSPCIERHFRSSKPTCPTCGALYGKVKGTQPRNGRMTHVTERVRSLPGYEDEDGLIVITYTFADGLQESCHPEPGKPYKGIQRKAFLPNSVEGREVLRLLKKAFDARLVFTIGDSKTRGESGLLTWNDIHHKTSLRGGPTKFGYPDPDYLSRVKEELASFGITSG